MQIQYSYLYSNATVEILLFISIFKLAETSCAIAHEVVTGTPCILPPENLAISQSESAVQTMLH